MKIAAALLLLLLFAPLVSLDSGVGSIASLGGEVRIDAFGKGAFIGAIKGDILYPATVLKTGSGGKAEIVVGGKQTSVGPGATVRIADLVAQTKKASVPWVSSFVELYKNLKDAAAGQSDVMLGTRAAEASIAVPEWVEEDDGKEKLDASRAKLESGDYGAALELLADFPADAEAELAQGRDYLEGRSHFSLEEYADAERAFASVIARASDPRIGFADEDMRVRTLFGLGVSRFMIGREKDAIAPLQELLTRDLSSSIDPFARLFFVKSLWLSGDTKRALEQLGIARKKYAGTAFAASFDPSPENL